MYQLLKQIAKTGIVSERAPLPDAALRQLEQRLGQVILKHFGRAIGDCGCTGGIFGESYASCGRVSNVIPVDVAVPGCPPTPVAILQGILTAITPGRRPRSQPQRTP